MLLSSGDAEVYAAHIAAITAELHPVGARESALVQSIDDTFWRLDRIPRLEMAIFASGREEFAARVEGSDLDLRPGLLETHTFLAYEKQLRNLQIQFVLSQAKRLSIPCWALPPLSRFAASTR